jgi:alcohol dehydrogenase (cytochrome c)
VLAADGTDKAADWPRYHRTDNGWRYSPLASINKNNVKHMKVAWINYGGEVAGGRQETPIVIDGVAYVISAYNQVQAIDATTGREIWKYKPKLDSLVNEILATPYSRGVSVANGRVYLGTLDGRGIALDQKTGAEVWSTQLTAFRDCHGCNFTSPPVVAGDVLTFGAVAGDLFARGKIYGVDASTGKLLWTFDTIKDDPKSWPGESGKYGGGGAWMPGQYDAETGTVFYGTSNASPDYFGGDRKGDNLYTASILALDAKTGALRWYRQEIPNDVWDFDSAYEMLFLKRDGRDVIVHLNKSGYVFVLDRRNGEIVNVWPLVEGTNFAKTIDRKTGELVERVNPPEGKPFELCPSLQGGRSWNQGSYDPERGLWFTNAMNVCNVVTPTRDKADPKAYGVGAFGTSGVELRRVQGKAPGTLDARDPVTGELKWQVEFDTPIFGSVLSTAGGVVFNADPLGELRAFDSDNGKKLFELNLGSGVRSGLVTYEAKGKQYILVPVGWGSFAATLFPSIFPELKSVNAASALVALTVE